MKYGIKALMAAGVLVFAVGGTGGAGGTRQRQSGGE